MPSCAPGVVVLGGGPAGLAAALNAARGGAEVTLVEAADRVGGLCRTLRRDGYAYDLGGHIPFVADDARRAWMEDLLDGELRWVDRPVASVRDGRVERGRYLDQRPPEAWTPTALDGSAAGYLGALVGAPFRDRVMRGYLEKVDGMALEQVPESRAMKLHTDQRAPDGFWYPADGIGALMDAMAGAARDAGARIMLGTGAVAVDRSGGRVRAVEVDGPAGPERIPASHLVVAIPPARASALMRPPPPPGLVPAYAARAVCLVFLAVARERLSVEPWIQVDDPRVPFSRSAEFPNWSPRMAPAGRTVLGLECYCRAEPADPLWALGDVDLARRSAEALAEVLGLLDDPGAARGLEVVRLPRAYPLPRADEMREAGRATAWLAEVAGVGLAQGGTIVRAVEAGEAAAEAALAALGSPVGTP